MYLCMCVHNTYTHSNKCHVKCTYNIIIYKIDINTLCHYGIKKCLCKKSVPNVFYNCSIRIINIPFFQKLYTYNDI